MRSANLLQVAGKYPDFPILAETWREVMSDHFDMPALIDFLRRIRSREVRVVAVDTERASPFASSLLSRMWRSSCTRATRRWPSAEPRHSLLTATC